VERRRTDVAGVPARSTRVILATARIQTTTTASG
jgi:hypothetical protein